jgi:hypothetical protein
MNTRHKIGLGTLLLALASAPLAAFGQATKVQDRLKTGTQIFIDGSADEVQLLVQANATQTSGLLILEDSAGNDVIQAFANGTFLVRRAAAESVVSLRRVNNTFASPAVAASGDALGRLEFEGWSAAASSSISAAKITAEIDGTPDSGGDTTDMPGRISFYTVPEGSSTLIERARITQGGDFRLVDSSANIIARLEQDGSFTTQRAGNFITWAMSRVNGTFASPTVAVNGDTQGSLAWSGYSAAAVNNFQIAAIRGVIDGVPDSGGDTSDLPGRIEFYTTPDGTNSVSKAGQIDQASRWTLGSTNGLGTTDGYHLSYGALVSRNGSNTRGSFTADVVTLYGANFYRAGESSIRALSSTSGVTLIETSNSSSSGGQVYSLQATTAGQTANSAITSLTSLHSVTAGGSHVIGPSGGGVTHTIHGGVNANSYVSVGSAAGSTLGMMTARNYTINGGCTSSPMFSGVAFGLMWVRDATANHTALFSVHEGAFVEINDHGASFIPNSDTGSTDSTTRILYTGGSAILRNCWSTSRTYNVWFMSLSADNL